MSHFRFFVEVDEIYNLACPASPIQYQHDPVQTTKTSVHGAINMLGLAKRLRCRILQASTSEVYGDPAIHPQTEDYWGHVNPIGPRSATTRESGVPKHYFLIITGSMVSKLKLHEYLTLMAPGCTRPMAG